jgi:hypothetical protein
MFNCILQASNNTYYRYEGEPTANLQEALCFESRYDADWEKDNNPLFKDGKIIPVIILDDGNVLLCKTQYLVVSYKPTKHDYCRNCLMGTYDSKHEMKILLTEEEVVEHIAQLDARLEPLDANYRHWVLSQDEIFSGYHAIDSHDHISSHMEKQIEERVKQLKKEKK